MTYQDRYLRNYRTLSPHEQSQLSQATVCVIGLGGLGGAVTEMLARIGVGHLTLVDGDQFDVSNLNRQLLSTEADIGLPKSDVAEKRVKSINSDVEITVHNIFLDSETAEKILEGSDVVVDCLDSINDRFVLQDAAKVADIPLVSGAIAGASGQVTTIFPEDKGFELIYGKRDTLADSKGVEDTLGNLSFCAMFIASVQASEAIKVLLGRGNLLRNRLMIVDLMFNAFDVIQLI